MMNTDWTIGFAVGLTLVLVVGVIIARFARRKGACRGQYDERQLAARARGYSAAYATLLIYLAIWMVLRALELPFFQESLSVLLGVLLSIAVFVGHSIFHDAYFKASESPRAWVGIICAVGLLNLGIGVVKLFRGASVAERLYDNGNLFVGALLVFTLGCVLIKRAMDRRAGEE